MRARGVLLALRAIDAVAFVAAGRTVAARAAILTRTLAAALAFTLDLLLTLVAIAPVLTVPTALVTRRTSIGLSAIRWRGGNSGVGGRRRCIGRSGRLRRAVGPALMLLMSRRTPLGTAAWTPDLDEGLLLGRRGRRGRLGRRGGSFRHLLVGSGCG